MTERQGITIASLYIENVKAVKAVRIEPTAHGLTVIGGKNAQGKTSILDAIAWTLGGKKYQPSQPKRADAIGNPAIKLTLSNGLVVERRGVNSSLTVIDPSGQRAGQTLLDSFVGELALNLPKFLAASTREKSETLLRVIGVGAELMRLDAAEKATFDERRVIGQIADSKAKHAAELPEYPDAPTEQASASALIAQIQDRQRQRAHLELLESKVTCAKSDVAELRKLLFAAETRLEALSAELTTAQNDATQCTPDAIAALEQQLRNVETINSHVAANQQKRHATDDTQQYRAQYDAKTAVLEAIRAERLALLANATLPLPGLMVTDGELTYNGQRWDCMSAGEQLRVGTAIVRALNPKCGFVLIDKLEQMDLDTLREFAGWLETEGLQCIATRVSTGDECSIIIEDGLPQGQTYSEVVTGEGTLIATDKPTEYGEF